MTTLWPLVGRGEELEAAMALRRAGGVLLVGPPGVGKSRLAAEVMDRTEAARSVRVRATAAAAGMPLGAFAQALAAQGDDGTAGSAARLAAASSWLLDGLEPDEHLALWVDDVHALDDTSATLLLGMATSGSVELVMTMRSGGPVPEAITALWSDELVGRLDVMPLDRADVEQLLELALPGGVDGLAAAALSGACAGNLLYLRELVAGLQASGELAEVRGRWFLLGAISAPPRLSELVADRLDRLSGPARGLLEAVALAEPFGTSALARQGHWKLVDELLDAGLVELIDDGRRRQLRAVHPMHMEVARALMSEYSRRRILADLIEAASDSGLRRRDDRRRLAAWQLDAGLDADPVVLVDAARDALLGADMVNAEWFARSALGSGDEHLDAQAAHLLGVALDDQGRHAESEVVLRRAQQSARLESDRVLLTLARAGMLFRGLGRQEQAIEVLAELHDQVEDQALRDELVAQRAGIELFTGQVDTTLELVAPLLRRSDDRAFCEGALQASVAHMLSGRSRTAMAIATRAFEVRIALGEQVQLAGPGIYLVALALAQLEHGEIRRALGTGQAGYQGAVDQRDRHGQAWMSVVLARAHLASGRLVEAVRFGREAAVVFGELRHPGARWGYGSVALAAGHAGDVGVAVDAIADLDAEPATPMVIMDAELHRARGWALVAGGHHGAARECFSTAASTARRLGQGALESAALHDLARVGAPADAVDRMDLLGGIVDGDLMAGRADHVRGLQRGDPSVLGRAAERFASVGAHLFAAEAATAASHAHARRGEDRAGAACAALARSELEHCDSPRTPALAPDGPTSSLTPREREVAGLAADGLSNREIADRLFVSIRTVENHLQHVYDKLGISSRELLGQLLSDR